MTRRRDESFSASAFGTLRLVAEASLGETHTKHSYIEYGVADCRDEQQNMHIRYTASLLLESCAHRKSCTEHTLANHQHESWLERRNTKNPDLGRGIDPHGGA